MGNGGSKRAGGGELGIDMNPLVIAGRGGESVDAILIDNYPVAVAKVITHGREQAFNVGVLHAVSSILV